MGFGISIRKLSWCEEILVWAGLKSSSVSEDQALDRELNLGNQGETLWFSVTPDTCDISALSIFVTEDGFLFRWCLVVKTLTFQMSGK